MSAYSDSLKLMREEQKFTREKWNYEQQMSATAHQREVEDLKAAGLNPVLSSGGSGATYSSTSDTSTTNSAASYLNAKIGASASKYVANMNYKAALAAASAQRYASDMAYASNVYNTDNSKSGSIAGIVEKLGTKSGVTDYLFNANRSSSIVNQIKKDPTKYTIPSASSLLRKAWKKVFKK